jgi:putative DNA primase/helicase
LEIFSWDEELISFFQRLIGMAIVGKVVLSTFIVLSGVGRNGKSMLVEVFSEILGPMVGPIRSDMLMEQNKNRNAAGPSPDIMSLRGKRICFASETDDGGRISTARIKEMTGKDTLSGRNPHDKYEVSFPPTHTLFLLTNHRPHAPADDFAFWERMILVPFEATFVERDPKPGTKELRADPELPEKLKAEHSGILAWMVRGCLAWQERGGLDLPPKVKAVINEYRRDEDVIQDFIDECCEVVEGAEVGASEVYVVFEKWWKARVSNFVPKQKRFGVLFGRRFAKKKDGIVKYIGVELAPGADDMSR